MNFIPMLLCRYSKVIQTYFGYFGHACFHSPKMIVSSCGKLRYLSTCKNKLHNSLLTILHFKESCNLIGWQHFGHNSRPKFLPDCWSNINNNISSQFRLSSRKTNMTKFFNKLKKPYFCTILGPFCPNLGKYEFSRKRKA